MRIVPAIMSGGAGTRLWPLSTPAAPKQFHRILSDWPMIVETALRFSSRSADLSFLPPILLAGSGHRELVRQQLSAAHIEPASVLLEPTGRNTAAAAAAAALVARDIAPGAHVLLAPADHLIGALGAFHNAITRAREAVADSIVTFGMTPTGPETGYGYIQQGEAMGEGVFRIAAFKEKPDRALAEHYLQTGGYSWNSGIFFFSPDVLLEEFEVHEPAMLDFVRQSIDQAKHEGRELLLDAGAFAQVEAKPIDIAIMEKTTKGAVVPCSIDWADVGSWAEYWRLSEKDQHDNAVEGSVLLRDVSDALVRSEEGMHVSVCGLSDIVVIATRDHVLILPRSRAQEVKDLIPES